jgi:hypothetical protein
VRALRHQPFLIWTIVLAILLGLAVTGLGAGEPAAPRVVSGAPQRLDADTLLEGLPSLTEAIGSGTLDTWISETRETVEQGVTATKDRPTGAAWSAVSSALDDLEQAAESNDRAETLQASGAYGSAVMALARSSR